MITKYMLGEAMKVFLSDMHEERKVVIDCSGKMSEYITKMTFDELVSICRLRGRDDSCNFEAASISCQIEHCPYFNKECFKGDEKKYKEIGSLVIR